MLGILSGLLAHSASKTRHSLLSLPSPAESGYRQGGSAGRDNNGSPRIRPALPRTSAFLQNVWLGNAVEQPLGHCSERNFSPSREARLCAVLVSGAA